MRILQFRNSLRYKYMQQIPLCQMDAKIKKQLVNDNMTVIIFGTPVHTLKVKTGKPHRYTYVCKPRFQKEVFLEAFCKALFFFFFFFLTTNSSSMFQAPSNLLSDNMGHKDEVYQVYVRLQMLSLMLQCLLELLFH